MTDPNDITTRIYRFGKRKRFYELLGGCSYLMVLFLVLWMSITLSDVVFHFSKFTRWGLLLINIPLLGYLFYRFVLAPYREWVKLNRESDLSYTAFELGKAFPGLGNALISIYQLIHFKEDKGTSPELRQAAIRRLSEKTSGIDFLEYLKVSDFLPRLRLLIPIILSASVLLGMRGENMIRSTLRLLNPTNDYLVVPAFHFEVMPGPVRILKNQPVQINAQYAGPVLEYCTLELFRDGALMRTLRMEGSDHNYELTVTDIKENASYRISGHPLRERHLEGHLVSDEYTIDVGFPPRIASLDVRLNPPAYSQLEAVQLDRNVGDISALAGTVAEVKIQTDKPVAGARLQFDSQRAETLQVRGNYLSGTFRIITSDAYRIILSDREGLTNMDPILYTITLLPDRPPLVDVVEPGEDIESLLDAQLQLKIEARDDFGIGDLYLVYRYVRSGREDHDSLWHSEKLRNRDGSGKLLETYYLWDFDRLPVSFDDGIKYYALVRDNNTVTGPQEGRSPFYYIRFPSIDDMFDSFAEKQGEETERMEDVASESETLKQKLEELNRDLKRETKLDWKTRQQIEETLRNQKDLQEKLENIRQELENLVEKLDRNQLISEEVLEKYMQIQELFREIATPELLDALNKLQESLDKSDPSEVQKALERFKMNQEAFKQNVDRTLELLKQVQLEQKMDQLVKQAEQLRDQQEKISEALEEQTPEDTEQLATRQKQQESSLAQLERGLDNLEHEPRMQQFGDAKKTLEEAAKDLQESRLSEQMQSLSSQLSGSEKRNAQKQSQEIRQQLSSLHDQLRNAQQQLQNQHKRDVQKQMISVMKKMLQLSFQQERIQQTTGQASEFSDDLSEMNKAQGEVAENFQKVLSSMVELSRQTFFMDPSLNTALGKTQRNIMESLGHLGERRKAQAAKSQLQAMQGMNESVQGLQKSLSQLSASSSGTGFEQYLEQLQQMAGMQGQINEGTLSLLQGQGNQGQFSLRQQGEMSRLAAQQRALQQAMEEMTEQMGQRDDVLGRLGELGGEMEEVVRDLLNMNVDRKTIERQQQILSRMLDAQKSVREREYSQKRKAEQAKHYIARDPGDPANPEDLSRKALQEALKKALNEGYKMDYQKLIEAYFKSLGEEKAE